ncbi:hypothetical protein ACROYT_G018800 [Oculina patagonica]
MKAFDTFFERRAVRLQEADSPETEIIPSHDAIKNFADKFTDLDKLYLALAEVGKGYHFGTLCYSLNITSLSALENYNSKDSTVLVPDEIDRIKRKLKSSRFDFEDLAQKYKQTKLVKMCEAKRIPIIPKKDVIVTRNVALGNNPVTGYVCEAQWTKPDGSKVKVCLRYEIDKEEEFVHEAEMANLLSHQNVLALHGVVITSSYSPMLAVVVEFAEHGQVIEVEQHHTVERLWKYTIQAATALEHLDQKKVIHRSVQPFNWFVVADYQLKLGGLAYCLLESQVSV